MTTSMSYLWNPQAVLLSSRVNRLTAAEECWYRRALDFSWIDDGLSADPQEVAERVGKKCTAQSAQKILDLFFEKDKSGKMRNEVQENARKKLKTKLKKLSEGGKRSGQKRREKKELSAEPSSNLVQSRFEPSTNNKSTITNVFKSSVEEEKNNPLTPPLEVYLGQVLAGVRKELNLKKLPKEREWIEHGTLAFENGFSVSQFLETLHLARKQPWRKYPVTAKTVSDAITELEKLRDEVGTIPTETLPSVDDIQKKREEYRTVKAPPNLKAV
jgi:hypothetical protein